MYMLMWGIDVNGTQILLNTPCVSPVCMAATNVLLNNTNTQ